jgi:hypothetical protein
MVFVVLTQKRPSLEQKEPPPVMFVKQTALDNTLEKMDGSIKRSKDSRLYSTH